MSGAAPARGAVPSDGARGAVPSDGAQAALASGAASLAASLDAQHVIYRSMLELTHREEDAIVAGDVAELTRIVDEKELMIERLEVLETDRMTALVAIADASGLDPDGATLSEIAALLPRDAGLALTESGVALRGCALALREANDRNARLLRSSYELVERWIHYLRIQLSGALYTAGGGAVEGAVGRPTLDRSA